jgi:hypothetical protein
VVAGVPYTCTVGATTDGDGASGAIAVPALAAAANADAYIIKNKRRDGGQRNKGWEKSYLFIELS